MDTVVLGGILSLLRCDNIMAMKLSEYGAVLINNNVRDTRIARLHARYLNFMIL